MARILVIEDESSLREAIMDWLTFEDYEVMEAADGVEGVNAAVRQSPDVIICDIHMPRLDGYGVLSTIRSNSALQSTPFIFLTSKASIADVSKGMQLGADDYITKPFSRLGLLQAIRTRLEHKHDTEHKKQIDTFKETGASDKTYDDVRP